VIARLARSFGNASLAECLVPQGKGHGDSLGGEPSVKPRWLPPNQAGFGRAAVVLADWFDCRSRWAVRGQTALRAMNSWHESGLALEAYALRGEAASGAESSVAKPGHRKRALQEKVTRERAPRATHRGKALWVGANVHSLTRVHAPSVLA